MIWFRRWSMVGSGGQQPGSSGGPAHVPTICTDTCSTSVGAVEGFCFAAVTPQYVGWGGRAPPPGRSTPRSAPVPVAVATTMLLRRLALLSHHVNTTEPCWPPLSELSELSVLYILWTAVTEAGMGHTGALRPGVPT